MKNTFYYTLLILGTAGMVTGFYAMEMDFGWRNFLANAGIGLLAVFYIASIWHIYSSKELPAGRRRWLFTAMLLPVFGGILYLIMQPWEALE